MIVLRSARAPRLWAMYRNDFYHVKAARVHIHRPPYDCGVELVLAKLEQPDAMVTVEICASDEFSELIQRYAHAGAENDMLVLRLDEELSWIRLPRKELNTNKTPTLAA